MKKHVQSLATLRHALFALMFIAGELPAFAAAAGVELKAEAMQEVDETVAGKTQKKLKPMQHAVPGTEVVYVITYQNTDNKPAESVVISNPVPAQLTYLVGSAKGDNATIDVSVDGGKSFGNLAKLTVPGADGKPRAATAADVTTVRWSLAGKLAAGAKGTVTYRAVLK